MSVAHDIIIPRPVAALEAPQDPEAPRGTRITIIKLMLKVSDLNKPLTVSTQLSQVHLSVFFLPDLKGRDWLL